MRRISEDTGRGCQLLSQANQWSSFVTHRILARYAAWGNYHANGRSAEAHAVSEVQGRPKGNGARRLRQRHRRPLFPDMPRDASERATRRVGCGCVELAPLALEQRGAQSGKQEKECARKRTPFLIESRCAARACCCPSALRLTPALPQRSVVSADVR